MWAWPISGTGNIRRWVPYAVAATAINVGGSIGGTVKFGLRGPLLGTLAAFVLIYSWSLPLVLKELFALAPFALLREALAPMIWGIPYCAAVWFAAHSHTPAGWAGLLGEIGLCVLIGAVLWWTLSLKAEARALWLSRMRIALERS